MWLTVLLMGLVAAIDPLRIATTVFMVSKRRAARQLLAYVIAGSAVGMIAGAMILFVLKGVGIGNGGGLPSGVEIPLCLLAVLFAAVTVRAIANKVRGRARPPAPGAAAEPADVAPGIEQWSVFRRLPSPIRRVITSESALVGWIVGGIIALPSPYYLATIAGILAAPAGVPTAVAALVTFNVLSFLLAGVSFVSFSLAPEATRRRVQQLYVRTYVSVRKIVTGRW